MFGIDSVAKLIETGLNKWVPDANVRSEEALEMARLVYKEAELEIQDRASARAREIAVKDRTPSNLAYITVAGFLVMSFVLVANMMYFHVTIPGEAWALIGTIVGYLSSKSELALAYYFGTSSSSQRKTEIMAGSPAK